MVLILFAVVTIEKLPDMFRTCPHLTAFLPEFFGLGDFQTHIKHGTMSEFSNTIKFFGVNHR